MARNPTWARDELILALDLYLRERRVLEETDERVVALSRLLNELPIHPERGTGNFRSPDAVVMKLANFRALDPQSPSVGLSSGGRLDREIWARLADDADQTARLAHAIRAVRTTTPPPAEDEDEDGVPEGRLLFRFHRARERAPALAARKKADALRRGRLACEVCGLEPTELYGDRGVPVLECHHRLALAEGVERRTRLADLALVCANCHRALHATRPWPSPEALRDHVRAKPTSLGVGDDLRRPQANAVVKGGR